MKYDIYYGDKHVRFALGRSGENPLFVIGVNPSTADAREPDPTLEKVEKLTTSWKEFDGFVMLNLYPRRASKPEMLSSPFEERLTKLNVRIIESQLRSVRQPTVWAAWGDTFDEMDDFKVCLLEIVAKVKDLNLNWKKCE